MHQFPVLVHGRGAAEALAAVLAGPRLFLALVDDADVGAEGAGVGQALAAEVAGHAKSQGLLRVGVVFSEINRKSLSNHIGV